MTGPKSVAVFSNLRPRDHQVAHQLRRALARAGLSVDQEPYDLILSVGGDGTFLESVRRYGDLGIPFAGVNTGSLGFLQENTPEDLDELVDCLVAGDYHLHRFPLLKARTLGEGKPETRLAFNDLVVERLHTRVLHLRVSVVGEADLDVVGDGLIVSTAAGSTAYAAAAGGPYIDPEAPVLQLVPISPHPSQVYRCLSRPLVLPWKSRLQIRVRQDKIRELRVVVDGAPWPGEKEEGLEVYGSEEHVTLLRRGKESFCSRLGSKFLGSDPGATQG